MPPEKECPACGRLVPDWHLEWRSTEHQLAIRAGTLAMECPFCRGGVASDGLDIARARSDLSIAKRDIKKAARWAKDQGGGSLADYLQSEQGAPFGGHWSAEAIKEADDLAAREE